jgi:general transcription factor 3C protein 4
MDVGWTTCFCNEISGLCFGELFHTPISYVLMILNDQTPEHGINVDTESLVKSSVPKTLLEDQQAIGWFRTMVHDSKLMEGTRWPDLSQGKSAPSVFSIFMNSTFVQLGVPYPWAQLTRQSRPLHALQTRQPPQDGTNAQFLVHPCASNDQIFSSLIALMTSNMDISLWSAGKNYLKGEWQKVRPFLYPASLSY